MQLISIEKSVIEQIFDKICQHLAEKLIIEKLEYLSLQIR